MTTPENLRRRQRRELGLVFVILFGSLIYAVYDSQRDEARRDCLVTTVEQLRDYQAVRDGLVAQATRLREVDDKHDKLGDDIQSDLIRDVFEAQDRNDVTAAFVRFDRRDVAWKKAEVAIDQRITTNIKKREATKVPAFPNGRCDSKLGKDDLK